MISCKKTLCILKQDNLHLLTASMEQVYSHVHCLCPSTTCLACHGSAGMENIYSGCQTNAAAEA